MKITRKVFLDLAMYMVGFGILIGIIFPYFVMLFHVPKDIAKSPVFVLACIGAGITVGLMNIYFARNIVIERINSMTNKMGKIQRNMRNIVLYGEGDDCNVNNCKILVDTDDAFGKSAQSYNNLIETLSLILYGEELNNYLNVEIVAEKAIQKIIGMTELAASAILLRKGGQLIPIKNYGIKNIESILDSSLINRSLENQRKVIIDLPKDILIDLSLIEFAPEQILIKPIVHNEKTIGLFLLASSKSFDRVLEDRLDILFKSMSRSLGNALVHSEVEKLASSDYLTEVYNKRFGLLKLSEEIEFVKRTKNPLSVIMFDLDHFKKINDVYGHLAGDKVLVKVAQLTLNEIRITDTLFRFGGEEFMIILRDTSVDACFKTAERIRKVIENHEIQYLDKKISITSSFGVASTSTQDVFEVEELISAVDRALYKSKENGRNQVTVEN